MGWQASGQLREECKWLWQISIIPLRNLVQPPPFLYISDCTWHDGGYMLINIIILPVCTTHHMQYGRRSLWGWFGEKKIYFNKSIYIIVGGGTLVGEEGELQQIVIKRTASGYQADLLLAERNAGVFMKERKNAAFTSTECSFSKEPFSNSFSSSAFVALFFGVFCGSVLWLPLFCNYNLEILLKF